MQLNELFSTTYPYYLEKIEDDGFEGKFYTKDDHEVSFTLVHSPEAEGSWEVEFGRLKSGPFISQYPYGITKDGDAYKVLATIVKMVEDAAKQQDKIQFVYFTADEPSRKKLYDAMIDRFVKKGKFKTASPSEAGLEDRARSTHVDKLYILKVR